MQIDNRDTPMGAVGILGERVRARDGSDPVGHLHLTRNRDIWTKTDTGEAYDVAFNHATGARYADRRPSPPDLGDGAGAATAATGDTDDGSQQLKEE